MSEKSEASQSKKVLTTKLEPRKQRDRVTIVETTTHQRASGQGGQFDSRFYAYIETDEQSYRRECKVGQDWQPVDIGWLKNKGCSQLVIRSDEPFTSDITIEVSTQRIESFETPREPFAYIPPTQSFRCVPTGNPGLVVRSTKGIAYFTVFAVPK